MCVCANQGLLTTGILSREFAEYTWYISLLAPRMYEMPYRRRKVTLWVTFAREVRLWLTDPVIFGKAVGNH